MLNRGGLRCADPTLDAPRADEVIDDHGHLVQFYEGDAFLAASVRDFIAAGFERGESGVIVATQTHRKAIDELLDDAHPDLQRLRNEGRYVLLDADETLSRFMVDGEPEPALFAAAVGSVVARAADAGEGVRVFGEMVALLWEQGNVGATLQLEELWNELAEVHPFSLLCAYPMAGFHDAGSFQQVCSRHTRVIPTESYTEIEGTDERMRAISELQRLAHASQRAGRRRALALNDEVIQGITAAKMALELGAYDLADTTLAATLDRAAEMVSALLAETGDPTIGPGDLRRD